MFANHPLVKTAAPSIYHPIGLTLEKFLYYFSKVKSFSVVGSSVVEPLNSSATPSTLADALNALDAANANSGIPVLSAVGEMSRITLEGSLNVRGEYPRFSFSNGGMSLVVDFGLSVLYFGLFYPWIELTFTNGASTNAGSRVVGSLSIFGGNAPLYSTDSYASVYASVSAEVETDFDELKLRVVTGDSATFSGYRKFTEYTRAYLHGAEGLLSAQGDLVTVILPQNAKSGHIRFASDGPHSSFLTLDRVNLSF